jgi:hypothetical protein
MSKRAELVIKLIEARANVIVKDTKPSIRLMEIAKAVAQE